MSNKMFKVKLATPMEVDGKEVSELELRKPTAGDLRGLNLVQVCEMHFDAAYILLPRISELNERDILNMETENFAPLMTEIASFFVDMKR
ncbi:phage tail assembly protein [Aliivibrio sp. S4TY2]|uniref:phage tail assembly protein n=1 Tax=unclassified Aliivibrio TaxID=2645654 RepID=UPI0023783E28|nr:MULTISPECIES: phage tail assembly protein [unclassified Aliivibrio]MDD9154938.1 phage tail assembly protein [Aliivibrio sp. S4TY2]MDD9158699.1 phage tail assembly protein [Aliivibrio sp. S4TY1]MDD9162941.1 phage tail assembly protein [Aliivibrio sp. S4MY2]MDD9166698.1 phage tail assembly protein [Aliivibrio sp. S4MY4]MDD9184018.1 phage tail assembly protein [Aliivibrio sp. S4MY3]